MIKRTSILILILLFTAWTSQGQTLVPRDTVITLQRFADAFNNGTDYSLTINSDGTVIFQRFRNPSVPGFDPNAPAPQPIRTTIAVENVAALVAEFERINFFSLRDRYAKIEDGCPGVWTDHGGAETSITINGKSKTIGHYHGCLEANHGPTYPAQLTNLELRIDEVVNTKQWLK